jgi:hypothetical protein
MSAVIDKEKVYRPTTGEEAIDLILNEFYKALVNSGLFPLHRVWHEFEIQGGVRVKGWSTKTEEVKFEAKLAPDVKISDDGAEAYGYQSVEARVDVRILPQAPDLLRETLPTFACPKCGREFKSKPAMTTHEKVWCKGDPDYLKKLDAVAEIIKSDPDGSPRAEVDRHTEEPNVPDSNNPPTA